MYLLQNQVNSTSYKGRRKLVFMAVGAFVLMAGAGRSAQAQIQDPFLSQDSAKWLTLDEYKASEKPSFEVQSAPEATPKVEASVPVAQTPVVEAPVKAEPERPLSLPSMTAKGVVVSDDVLDALAQDDAERDRLDSAAWHNLVATEYATTKEESAQLSDNISDNKSFSIRLSMLPNGKSSAVLGARVSQSIVDRQNLGRSASKASDQKEANALRTSAGEKVKTNAKNQVATKEQNVACEALVEYRRRQLDALESDRKTLAQIKSALSELKLTNKLSFMNQPDGFADPLTQEASQVPSNATTGQPTLTRTP